MVTKKLKKGGDIMVIDVVDHIIVCDSGFYSFADESTTKLEDLENCTKLYIFVLVNR